MRPPGWAWGWARAGALILCGIALAALAWQLVPRLGLFVSFNRTVLGYPWTIDYDEGVNFGSAYLLSQGQNPYGTNADGFISTPYPPVHAALNALLLSFGGLGLLGGRVLALIATLATALLATVLVAREAGWRLAGLLGGVLAAGLFLALGPTIVWASFYKQDMLALALGMAGICWVARWPAGRAVYGALPWFVLAVYTKQTAATAPAAAVLYLLWRDWRAGLRFAAACAAALVLPALVLQVATGGGFLRHTIGYHAFPWQGRRFIGGLRHLARVHRLLLVLAALGLVAVFARRRPTLLGVYSVVGQAALLGNGTIGANHNHALEALLGDCLLGGALVARLAADWRAPLRVAAVAAVLALAALQVPHLGAVDQWFARRTMPTPLRAERLARIERLIASTPGEVFCEDSFLALRAGKPPRYYDLSSMGPLAATGTWDERPFVRDLRERRFALIVLHQDPLHTGHHAPSWSPAAFAALRDNYRLLYRDAMFTYVPR